MVAFLIPILISIALSVISYLITPKPKAPKPEAAKDMDNPTSEAGREMPVIFGSMTMKGLNVLDFSEKNIRSYEVKS
ncbi:hypothetical protein [Sphingomonas sp. TREG-RG-20F-R18-01]|uniref:hypothetical protein n=1 Tax=Sphingomonas sp. TREG-RG-20F-R18-01 TaxID=2914982 RepID=UPI001F568A4A|nr:hypothetical protein [Sphingomonas sp. TREG-RG-20F-R18-01]